MRRVFFALTVLFAVVGTGGPVQAIDDTEAPTVTITGPAKPFQLESTASATWTGSDGDGSGIDVYKVRYKKAQGDQGFGVPTTSTIPGDQTSSPPVDLQWGITHCFSVSAKDLAGNTSAFTPWRCTSVPVDDGVVEADSSWEEVTSDNTYWNETVTKTTVLGAKMKSPAGFTLQVKRVGVVATVCATCGAVQIKVGSTTIGTISLVAPETKHQRMRTLPIGPLVTGRFKVIVTTSGKPVEIDGVAFSRK